MSYQGDGPLRITLPLQRRKIIKKSITAFFQPATIAFLFVAPFVWALARAGAEDLPQHLRWMVTLILIMILLLIFSLVVLYQYLYFRNYFYDVDKENLIIRKGVIANKEVTLPFSKITDVYVDQDLLDALFHLYDVHVSTPTESSGKFAHIDGISKKASEQLRALLLENVNKAMRSGEST